MSLSQPVRFARFLALAVPAALLGGAYVSQYGFGLYPCEMCWWQRWPHFVAIGLAMLAFTVPPQRVWTALAALAILTSGAIGLFHAGVEYGWWPGITSCAVIASSGAGSALENIMNTPLVRCDEPAWTLLGISLAGFNFLISSAAGLAILALLAKDRRT
ncbi:disulfide bond formation protein B [Qipengyuania sp.]|uniref:disulfide bond formation protein B n=1 Tax=Qipengyuania sp. TaxID=2004515 RepID=UPI0035154463